MDSLISAASVVAAGLSVGLAAIGPGTVSYTHLTLPTKLAV